MKKLRKAYIALIMAFLYAPIVLLILFLQRQQIPRELGRLYAQVV